MSFPFYKKLWIATRKDLKNVVLREKVLPQLEPTLDRVFVHRLIGNLFARYIILCNNLSDLYDQTFQVQKRSVIEKILISSTNRLLELQKEMRKIEMSEFVYIDDALVELKLTPQNIEFLRPFYFPRKRDIEAQQVINEVPKLAEGVQSKEELTGLNKYRKVLTPEELEAERIRKLVEKSSSLIKIHEKAKQARVNWLNMKIFPETFKPKRRESVKVSYDFIHQPDQVPLHKINRTIYKTNLYKPKVNIAKFKYYEPPKYRINRLGQAVLIPKILSETVEQLDDDDSELNEAEIAKQIEDQLKVEADLDLTKKRDTAAIKIQRCYRYYLLKKALKKRNWERKITCGLVRKPHNNDDDAKQKYIEENLRNKRRERKQEFDEALIKALDDEKARILKVKSEFIMEDISDDIRQWFKEFYDGAKDFHRYPEEFEGGTIMVVRGETLTPEEFLVEKKKTPAQKAKEKTAKKRKKKEAKTQKKKQAALDKKAEVERIKLENKQGPTWNFTDKKYQSKNFGIYFCSRNSRS